MDMPWIYNNIEIISKINIYSQYFISHYSGWTEEEGGPSSPKQLYYKLINIYLKQNFERVKDNLSFAENLTEFLLYLGPTQPVKGLK